MVPHCHWDVRFLSMTFRSFLYMVPSYFTSLASCRRTLLGIVFQLSSSSHSPCTVSFLRPVHCLFLSFKSSSNSFSPFSWLTLLVLTWLPRPEIDIPLKSLTLFKNLLIVSSSAWHLPSACLSPQHDRKPHGSRDCLVVFIRVLYYKFVVWNIERGQ